VHINYLMWALWFVAALVIFAAHVFRSKESEPSSITESHFDDEFPEHAAMAKRFANPPGFLVLQQRTPFVRFAFSSQLWFPVVIALILASPWYIRNLVLTGNPVYAFYSNIFVGSVRVNPDVMRSAQQEWLQNGDGLGTVGHTLPQKLRNSWLYFVSGSQNWKLMPVFPAFVWPGVVIACVLGLWQIVARVGRHDTDRYFENRTRVLLPALALFGLLWFYAYGVADYYLYQIIVVLPLFGFFSAFLLMAVRVRALRGILFTLCLVIGFAPGLIMALMGSKLKNTGVYQGMPAPQMNLTPLRKLFMNRDMFYRMEFGGDMEMIGRVNAFPETTVILTHENRHLLLNPKHKIIHLDDWEVQAAYGKPVSERVAILDALKIEYYWYVPNEDNHVINMLVGMDELIEAGYFVEAYRTAASGASNTEFVKHTVIPPNQNVLYKRTDKKPDN
jgi:hypothetical protein